MLFSTAILFFSILNLLAIFYFSYFSFPTIKKYFLKIPKRILLLLALLLVSSFFIKAFIYPNYFSLYLDDYYPIEAAKNILNSDFKDLRYNFVPNGLLLVPSFLVLGADYRVAMLTMILISILALFLFFLFSCALTRNHWVSIIATSLIAFNASHIFYSFSAYNHTPVFFFIVLALFSFFLHLNSGNKDALYLSMASILYLTLLRAEIFLLIPFLLFLYLKSNKSKLKKLNIWVPWLVFLFFLTLPFLKSIMFISEIENYPNTRFTIDNLSYNILNSAELLSLNYILIAIFFLGLILILIKKEWDILVILSTSFLFIILYFSLSYTHIYGGRLFHYSISILYLVMAFGIVSTIEKAESKSLRPLVYLSLFAVLFIMQFGYALKYIDEVKHSESANKYYFDTRVPAFLSDIIPENCIIVSPHPDKFTAATNLASINIGTFNESESSLRDKCYLFVDDLSCAYPEGINHCKSIKERYNLTMYTYIDTSMIRIPSKNMIINSTVYLIK